MENVNGKIDGNGDLKLGFAAMDKAKQKEIASKGGKAAHAVGSAHEFNAEEARAAGKKGGLTVSANKDHMREIGRKGGLASQKKKVAKIVVDSIKQEQAGKLL